MALNLLPLTAAQAGAQTAAPAPQGGGTMDELLGLFQTPEMGMSLLQAGLSMLSGVPAGQAFSQGLGLYNQYKAGAAQAERTKKEDAYKERELGQKDTELGVKKYEAETNRMKLAKDAKDATPKGVDEKRWGEALKTVELGTPLGADVDIAQVYRTYNSMLGEGEEPAYMPYSMADRDSLMAAMLSEPDLAPQYLERAGQIFGPKVGKMLGTQFTRTMEQQQKEQERLAKEKADKEAAEAEAAAKLPPALSVTDVGKNMGAISNYQAPATQTVNPADIYRMMVPQAPNPWAGRTF